MFQQSKEFDFSKVKGVRDWFIALQKNIIQGLEKIDGQPFLIDEWQKAGDLGGGITGMLENGGVFERAGIGFSHVKGDVLPASATAIRPQLAGRSWEAMGVSLVFHPTNPYVPTVHFNTRFFVAMDPKGADHVWWFGGGMDLTPYYPFKEDVVHFHRVCRDSLLPFGEQLYPRMKKACDDYFVLRHRGEQRGVGGIFFDDFDELGFDQSFAMVRSVGDGFLKSYLPIVERRQSERYGEAQRTFQAYRRGRYVEFNLVYDRGTLFGLQSQGRTESILLSMPPVVRWGYQWKPEPNSPESVLLTDYLVPKDWV